MNRFNSRGFNYIGLMVNSFNLNIDFYYFFNKYFNNNLYTINHEIKKINFTGFYFYDIIFKHWNSHCK